MRRLPAEWETQAFIQLTLPDKDTDWREYLPEVLACYRSIASAIVKHQKLLIVCRNISEAKSLFDDFDENKIHYAAAEPNDTWARDHGGITVFNDEKPTIYNFRFNGWGLKFPAEGDNRITATLFDQSVFEEADYVDCLDFVLEGGSIESNGKGCLLTTEKCLLSKNRNEQYNKSEIEAKLKTYFELEKIHWLKNGALEGDDTDSHIDTLARFASENTITYVQCTDTSDSHYRELKRMEDELKQLTDTRGNPYRLVPLPMVPPIYENDERLPATYANFSFINNAVLVPVYRCDTDSEALHIFVRLFPDKEIIPIDCRILIKQHGSLHCVTMHYPEGL